MNECIYKYTYSNFIEALLLSLSSHARWVFSCDCMTEYFIILILLSNDYVRSLSPLRIYSNASTTFVALNMLVMVF